ncbi:Rossmann fold nucleotide-binding protein Smf possibly involved in DNA uptake [Marinobacterium lacunae]|uniref:Rossmann fold nucleotide-binding protein Smf possibly involved in DNA uptake n=1 Tax=Marinobacterium lacunae TaxID=1232683 RepID=A0A081FVC0_9GAMM|nr:DNA-processing protein DprA [Marinobacterium lacunae]KEA62475.1 Rossmann fold nucleotide-binding protein Smf possibly involved in DNA uptake [Marinobacterium lacunae]
MSDPKDWIAATLLPRMGPATMARLRSAGVAASELMHSEQLPGTVQLRPETLDAIHNYRSGGALYRRACELEQRAAHSGWTLLTIDSPQYPDLLKQIHDPPILLWIHGDPDVLALPQLAVVGSRHASAGGVDHAYRFALDLAAGGLAITSGLARGIDAAAHKGALDAGRPTLAVLGTGLDRCYPAAHRALAEAIVQGGGALVTEYPPGTAPVAHNFPRRNRIISGMSIGTLVVEAAPRSGSLITAREALEQGREVFALPGSIHNPLSKGCHSLIKQGAKLAESSDDILSELGALLGCLALPVSNPDDDRRPNDLQDPLLEQIPFDPIAFDLLADRVDLPAAKLQQELMRLELEGYLELRGAFILRTV